MFWFSLTLLILGFTGLLVLKRHLRETKLVRLREMIHLERMASLEKDIPVSDSGPDAIELLVQGEESVGRRGANDELRGFRLTALALGLTSVLAGIAALPALYYQTEPDVRDMWPIGFIPAAIGVGLLLFVFVTRGLVKDVQQDKAER